MTVLLKQGDTQQPRIEIVGRFDFTSNREFRQVCDSVGAVSMCVVDLKDTTYLDSSALGMMLLLKEKVPNVQIVGATAQVRKVLEIANFHSLFEVV